MKSMKYFTLLCFLVAYNLAYSQASRPEILFIDFEDSESVVYLNDSTNIWQVGKPNKSLFKSSYSGKNAIVTDTVNAYPANNRSSFLITLYKSNYEGIAYLFLNFYNFFNTDALTDSAFVDFSYDGGESWHIGSDQGDIFDRFDFSRWENPVVSGNSGGWVEEYYFWGWYDPVKTEEEWYYPDSIMIRFNFISDSIQTNKDGWMIDDIKFRIQGPGGIYLPESSKIKAYPNPSDNFILIESIKLIEAIKVYSLSGQIIYYLPEIYTQNYSLNIEKLEPGIYLLELQTIDGLAKFDEFIKY